MSYASDDLAPVLAPQPGPGVGYRQGIIREWNPATAENVVDVAGTLLTNLPILNTNEALLLAPDDVVGILTAGPSWCILGRLTIPGTAAAASALSMVSSGIAAGVVNTAQTTTSQTYTDLATAGPSATATIRASGKCLVIVSGQIGYNIVGTRGGGAISYTASGANTLSTGSDRSVNHFMDIANAPTTLRKDQFGATFYHSGLTPGSTTFAMKYRSQQTGVTVEFADRVIVVIPL